MELLIYSEPKTKEQIMTNLVYLLRKNNKMKDFKAFDLKGALDCSKTDGVRWTFLESILPELNDFFNQKWKEYQLPINKAEIERLESMLKDVG